MWINVFPSTDDGEWCYKMIKEYTRNVTIYYHTHKYYPIMVGTEVFFEVFLQGAMVMRYTIA